MTPEQQTQLKGISLQASSGDLDKAVAIFQWLAADYVDAEVARRLKRIYGENELAKAAASAD